jgi:tetratricopeptide (TPR) repeat protein
LRGNAAKISPFSSANGNDPGEFRPHRRGAGAGGDTGQLLAHSHKDCRILLARNARDDQGVAIRTDRTIAHNWFAYPLFFADRRDEALAEIALARQLDPLSAGTNADEGHFLYAVHHFDEARAKLRRAMELAPEFAQPHGTLALVELESGHRAEAIKEARTALALDPNSPRIMGEAGYVLASTEHAAESRELLSALQDAARRGAFTPVFSAMLEIGLGQRDQALESLSKMVESGGGLEGLVQWHAFDELSADSRFKKLLAKTPL